MKKIIIFFIAAVFLTGCAVNNSEVNYLSNGQDYLKEYKYTEALNAFNTGRTVDPSKEDYYLAIGDIYLKKGDLQEGERILTDGYNNTKSVRI